MDRERASVNPFASGIYTGLGDDTRLLATRDAATGRLTFPAADGDPVMLSPDATLYSFTTVRVRAPFGLPSPYATGYVDTPEGLRLFALLDPACNGAFRIGAALRLTSAPLGVDLNGACCERPFYTLAKG